MTVSTSVASARDVNPIILPIGCLEDQLIEISVVLQPVEPLASSLQVTRQDVGSFANGVLGGIDATHFHVERIATVATADVNGTTHETAKGFEDFLSELLQHGNVLRRYGVVDAIGGSRSGPLKLRELEMRSKL